MYANAPHASATTPPLSSLPQQHQAPQVQHAHPQGMPPAVQHGGSHGMQGQAAAAPMAPMAHGYAASRPARPGASFVTGAYQASGDPAIDRMIRLEAALKRFGSPL